MSDSHENPFRDAATEESEASVTQAPRRQTLQIKQTAQQVRNNLLTLDKLLNVAMRGGASDLLLKVGQTPMFRYNGELYPLRDGPRIDRAMIEAMVSACIPPDKIESVDALDDVDTGYYSQLAGRVRVNIFRQRGELGMVARLIPAEVPSVDDLGMGQIIKSIAEFRRGLVLVTGATGSGKSTTLAAMIDHINRNRTAHIITIEDPIEYVHVDKRSMINQREIGVDTSGFASALRSALRQNPDVILVGELRDEETIETALNAAETGHLVFSTMHTIDAADAMMRMMSALGPAKEPIVRTQIAESLRAVISQRLVRRSDRKGRVAAQEILINTATIRERMLKGAPPSIVRDFIAQGQNYGMQTFDQHLFQLCQQGAIEWDEGYNNASNRDDFNLRMRGISNDDRS